MRSKELCEVLSQSLATLKESQDELRDLDQALGDGDMGITVALGSDAIIEALEGLPETVTPPEVARAAAKAFANANPSTLAALVAGALLAGSKTWTGIDDVDVAAASAFIRAGGESIAVRGKTQLGDKTILDAIMPVADAIGASASAAEAADAAVAAAEDALSATTGLQSRRGRASWLQERSIGLPDPGVTGILRLTEAWRQNAF